MVILGFLTIPWLGPKDTEPHVTLVPKAKLGHTEPCAPSVQKAKLGHTEPRAPSVPKAKLGHLNCVHHRVILPLVMAILGFLTIPWLGPKDTEPHETSVPKAKLGHTEPRAPSIPKAKLGHSNRVHHRVFLPLVMVILGFLTIPLLGPKYTEPRV